MHTDLQKCPHFCPQCPHVSPPALLFPDLGHDLKPFLMPKLRVHIVKNCHLPTRAPFPSGPSLLHSHSEWDAPRVGQSKAFQSMFIFFLTLQSSSLVPTACQSDSTSDFTFLAQHSNTQGQAVIMGISFVLIYVPSCGL